MLNNLILMFMRDVILLMLFASSGLAVTAQTNPKSMVLSPDAVSAKGVGEIMKNPKGFDPFNLSNRISRDAIKGAARGQEGNAKGKLARNTPAKQLQRVGEKVDTVQYYAAMQSYYSGMTFIYEGGDVLSYNVGIAIDGTKVTFTNLFNLYNPNDYQKAHDLPVSGTYDAQAKTITIPTKTSFAEATICGDFFDGTYPAVLASGTIDSDGKLVPSNELVFNVEGDFDRITTDQAVCAVMYTADGSQSYGVQEAFKKLYIQKP